MSKKRNICILTGTRAEYGLLKPVIQAVSQNEELSYTVLVTGMHLSDQHGLTINEIRQDGYTDFIKTFEMHPADDSSYEMAKSVGVGIQNGTAALSEIEPEILVVLGDRAEILAGVIAAAYLNIPIAHIHGGDVSQGGLDESARHAITKFAHIHFAATALSAKRIKLMGEDPSQVYTVGAPGLDSILNETLLGKTEIQRKFQLDELEKNLLLIQHPVTTQVEEAESQITETLAAIEEFDCRVIIIYPNNDAGNDVIISKLESFAETEKVSIHRNLKHIEYLSLLAYVDVLVGNSSSGIIESSSFKLPVINIGMRQKNRERSTNVIDVEHDREKIKVGILYALSTEFREKIATCVNPYGDGTAGKQISSVLTKIELDHKLLQKKFMYE